MTATFGSCSIFGRVGMTLPLLELNQSKELVNLEIKRVRAQGVIPAHHCLLITYLLMNFTFYQMCKEYSDIGEYWRALYKDKAVAETKFSQTKLEEEVDRLWEQV